MSPGTELDGNAGVDVFCEITLTLRANFTVNTDFAQTDIDQRQVNLTSVPDSFLRNGRSFLRAPATSALPAWRSAEAAEGRSGSGRTRRRRRSTCGAQCKGQVGRQVSGVLQVRTGENSSVSRVERRRLSQPYVGVLYTLRNPHAALGEAQQTAGVDVRLATSRSRRSKNLFATRFSLRYTAPLGDRFMSLDPRSATNVSLCPAILRVVREIRTGLRPQC